MSQQVRNLKWMIQRYGRQSGEHGPVAFVREMLQIEPDEWQTEVLKAFGRGDQMIAMRSAHGVGKSTVAAWLVWIMLCTRYRQKTAITAPAKGQAEDALVSEIRTQGARLPPWVRDLFDVKQGGKHISMKPTDMFPDAPADSFVTVRTAKPETPEALAGKHSDNVLLVVDEASGVHEKVFESALGSMAGEKRQMVLMGNPTRTSGFFYNAFNRNANMWTRFHVSGVPVSGAGRKRSTDRTYHSPRTPDSYVDLIRNTYGEGSSMWKIRVGGDFPETEDQVIVPWDAVEDALQRWEEEASLDASFGQIAGPEIWGVDVARYGGDQSAFVRRGGRLISPRIEVWHDRDLMYAAGRVAKAYREAHKKPALVLIDEIGLGGGVVDRLKEMAEAPPEYDASVNKWVPNPLSGMPVRGVNVSVKLKDSPYENMRTDAWFDMRDWFIERQGAIPLFCTCGNPQCGPGKPDDHATQLAAELTQVRFDVSDSRGKILAEPKRLMRKRGLRSPNLADALMLTFTAPQSALARGSKGSGRWGAPIRPDIAVV